MASYLCNPQEIYRRSFDIVREETALDDLPSGIADIAVRLIHACGMPDIVSDLAYSTKFERRLEPPTGRLHHCHRRSHDGSRNYPDTASGPEYGHLCNRRRVGRR